MPESLNKNVAIVYFYNGPFGGATRRFSNLFFYIRKYNPNRMYFFINNELFQSLKEVYPNEDFSNIFILSKKYSQNIIQSEAISGNVNSGKNSQNFKNRLKSSLGNRTLFKIIKYNKTRKIQFNLFKEIEQYRKTLNIDVFLGIFSGIFPLYFYLRKPANKRPSIIFSDMDSWFDNISLNYKRNWYKKFNLFNHALKKCDHIDFLSPYILNGVKKRGIKIDESKVSITECSFADYSNCKANNKTNFGIAFASRLVPDKNPMLFLKASKHIHHKYPDVEFYLLGNGPLKNEIQEYIQKENLNKIIKTGFHPNPIDVFSKTSVFVSLQKTNNYPSQSILEAMGCGNAIIASDVGDTRMFVSNKNGVLINLSETELIKAMEYLILNQQIAKEMGIKGRKLAFLKFTLEKSADYYINLFNTK